MNKIFAIQKGNRCFIIEDEGVYERYSNGRNSLGMLLSHTIRGSSFVPNVSEYLGHSLSRTDF